MLIYTIGHSRHSPETFIELLKAADIQVVVDVRSAPYSEYAPHFNADKIKALLASAGIQYLYMGKELGGRPAGSQFYDEDGYVLYNKLAESPLFKAGISRLIKGASDYRIAIMCSEGRPDSCHRHLLITRVLNEKGIDVSHILDDGSIQPVAQMSLFPIEEVPGEWRSTQSVLQKKQHPSSSES
ncbi:MAG: DUF488 family protein [Limnochordia bacterium]|jgi:uncharacterized protein (DUF488 family)